MSCAAGGCAAAVPSGADEYARLYPEKSSDGVLRLGNVVPDFAADSTMGPINWHQWIDGSWAILFSHPADFTPVCTTEIGRMSLKYAELAAKGVKLKDDEGLPLTCRAVFIIGPDKKLKLSLNYPASVGRNMDEIVRVVDALQLSAEKSVATPANWPNNHADQGMKGWVFLLPTVTASDAKTYFPEHKVCEVPSGKDYLRLTPAESAGKVPVAAAK